ncbi:MAG TPA: serine hydrolase, partial [Patescibacteria group bacterium]|nr:serine hydrolase [Patescibacteria group bacterium]
VPVVTAKAVLMYDLTSEKALFEKNPKEKLPMASLTKVMTAIVSLENPREDNRYVVHGYNLVGEDSMGLSAGEVLTLEELLYGLMLPSGNDAAEVLASNSPFGREGFIKAMNDRAKAMGLTDTQFSNPSGLQGDGMQYTTTYDLLVITRYALEHFPLFAEIVTHPEYILPATSTHPEYYLVNETNLLTTYDGVKGVKTGYTPEAGLCLITYLDYGGHKIIGILLNSENRRAEMKELLDYSLTSVEIKPPKFRGGV